MEALPVEDASFDVVLCTQVLEHADDPAQAVRELRRVTAPAVACSPRRTASRSTTRPPSTTGAGRTTGLRRLFAVNAEWSSLSVEPAAGTGAALAMLLGTYVEIALRRTVLARPPVWLLNRLGTALDARSSRLREPLPGSLIPNLHVVGIV